MAETFPEHPIEHWFYLPSQRGVDGWITIRACAILRHDQRRARHGNSFNRLSPTMRMKWKHFVDDLEAELFHLRPEFTGFGRGTDRDAMCFWALIENGGGKPRFRAFWEDDAIRDLLYQLDSTDAEFWRLFVPPTEIQCLQGSGGDQILDLASCLPIPDDLKTFTHL